MVHALEEIHRLLKPDACLIDIHPFIAEQYIEVHQGGKIRFTEPVPELYEEDIRQAEDALAQVVQRQMFLVERAASFDFRIYASSLGELQAFLDDANAFEEDDDEAFTEWASEVALRVEEAMQAAGQGTEVVYREKVNIYRLKRNHGG